ncbi:MAG TPA: M20/M25/M40 family metallo-hydrolase [Candidatus Cybelea sp.]|nr:M20/M25/M40 family metallo-hydrolase [Candidatus Cybelea sp.]
MNVFELTRALVDIESVTGNEAGVGSYILDRLLRFARSTGGRVERMDVEADRFNVFASWGEPIVTLSTHMDTVPPFLTSGEEEDHISGRGSCDAKGIMASMIGAAEKLRADGVGHFALLFLVGEERDGAGARVAAQSPRGSRYLINGEPTENKLAVASKGALRLELIARGVAAHSAYPELGESAVEKLLDVLDDVRRIPLPSDELLGPSTLNIGTISAGRAPNVIADYARAEIMIRTVGGAAAVEAALVSAAGARAEVKEILAVPPVNFERVEGFSTTVVSYTTDVPILGPGWGKPLLIGPGNIHLAHTAGERVSKKELVAAVDIYAALVGRLLSGPLSVTAS